MSKFYSKCSKNDYLKGKERILIVLYTLLSFSCSTKQNEETEGLKSLPSKEVKDSPAKLLFSSGFEGVTLSPITADYEYIKGTDIETGFSWPPAILGSTEGGIHRVLDDGGPAIDNRIETIIGAKGDSTTALFQRLNYDISVTQSPYQINKISENPEELYISYWMKTDDTSLVGKDIWRSIWSYKTDDYASYQDGFRMIAFMATDFNGNGYWKFQGDISPTNPVWEKENRTLPLILNEWFKVEYYIKWSAGDDGYASMKVNGILIGDYDGPTTANSDDMNFMMLTQVYGNSHPMHQWVDDVEIWDGIPNQ